MNTYQKHLFKIFEEFRQPPQWPNYPPYKEGDYFEERFIKFFLETEPQTKRYFIPVAWSSCYINNRDVPLPKLQETLLSLKQDEEYFMVGVHDDAPREIIPPQTMRFLAGGNKDGIPIPVVVNKIPNSYLKNVSKEKKFFASFVGSMTHKIRDDIYEAFKNNPDIIFQGKAWSPSVSEEQLLNFLNTTSQSHFSLCPRGYAPTSCRVFESMQLGTVPVYVSDRFWLPWSDEIDWESICILSTPDEISYLDLILRDCLYSDEYQKKLDKIKKIYDNFFTHDVIIRKIIERVNK